MRVPATAADEPVRVQVLDDEQSHADRCGGRPEQPAGDGRAGALVPVDAADDEDPEARVDRAEAVELDRTAFDRTAGDLPIDGTAAERQCDGR